MVTTEQSVCPKCGGALKYYDSVPRIVRTKEVPGVRAPVSMRPVRSRSWGIDGIAAPA